MNHWLVGGAAAIAISIGLLAFHSASASQENATIVVDIRTALRTVPAKGTPVAVSDAGLLATCKVLVYPDLTQTVVAEELAEPNAVPPGWLDQAAPDNDGRAVFMVPEGRYAILHRGCFGELTSDDSPKASDFGADCCARLRTQPQSKWVSTESGRPAFQVQVVEAGAAAPAKVVVEAMAEKELSEWDRWLIYAALLAVLAVIVAFAVIRRLRPTYNPRSSPEAKSLPPETEEERESRRVRFEDVFGDGDQNREE